MEMISREIKDFLNKRPRVDPTPEEVLAIDRERVEWDEVLKLTSMPSYQYIYERLFGNKYLIYQNCSLDNCGEYGKQAMGFLERGYGIYIHGNVGSGKTYLALSCLKYWLKSKRVGNIYTIGELLDRLRMCISQKRDMDAEIRRYTDIDMLVIDDLGVGSTAGWADGKVFDIINSRWLQRGRKITIVTTNHKPSELINQSNDEIVGRRIVSRLRDKDMCKIIEIKGPDRRRERI